MIAIYGGWLDVYSSRENNCPRPVANETQQSDNTHNIGSNAKAECSQTTSNDQASPRKYKPNENTWAGIKALFSWIDTNVLLTVFNGLLVLFTYRLYRSTDDLRAETKRLAEGAEDQSKKMVDSIAAMNASASAMRDVATETERIANASRKSADTAERALINLERPFVYVQVETTGIQWDDRGGRPHFQTAKYHFLNYGRTPANIVEINYEFVAVEKNRMPTPPDNERTLGRTTPVGTIATINRPYTETENLFNKFSLDIQSEIGKGEKIIWLVGYIKYDDTILGRRHTTGFCLRYDPLGNAFVARGDMRYNYMLSELAPDER